MGVTLRERVLAKGEKSVYLDIYHKGNRHYEFLFKIGPKDNKKEKKAIAETIRSERELELLSQGSQYVPESKKKLRLIDYFNEYLKNYEKADIKVIRGTIIKFMDFIADDKILIGDLKESHFLKYIDYLNNPKKSGLKRG